MERKEEALITQSLLSSKKTIYVEGNLDLKTIRHLLERKQIQNIKVVEINNEVDDTDVPVEERKTAKEKLISLIEKANSEVIDSEYIGIVDLDYDFFTRNKKSIENLYYTDFNSMESYLIDLQLINLLLSDYDIPELDEERFEKWKTNSLSFSFYFYFQITNISTISKENTINFRELKLCNERFTNFSKEKINLKNLINDKIQDSTLMINDFIKWFFEQNRKIIYANLSLFLHGKHTLRYIICLLKNIDRKIKNMREETIIYSLRDKLMLNKYKKYPLFNEVLDFANKKTTANIVYK